MRLTAYKTFALEMARAALAHPNIPRDYHLAGVWRHLEVAVDMDMWSDARRRVVILLSVHGATGQVEVVCDIVNEGDCWDRGTCRIQLTEARYRSWEFDCYIESNRVSAIFK